jgi:hypothetical protein
MEINNIEDAFPSILRVDEDEIYYWVGEITSIQNIIFTRVFLILFMYENFSNLGNLLRN